MFTVIVNSLPGAVALGLIWGVMAVGLFITYKILDFADLTVDGSICTGAVVCAVMVTNGSNVWLAMFCAILAGAAAGLVTGLLHSFFGIPPIMSGILTQLMLWSINLKILGKSNVSVSARNFKVLISQLKVPAAIGILFGATAIVIFILYWFFGTERGCSIRATGSNSKMAKAQGINTEINKIIALMISNGLVALSGALLCQYQGFADVNMGRGAIVIGLAAVIIGEALNVGLGYLFKGTAVLGVNVYGLFGAKRKNGEKFAIAKRKASYVGTLLGKNFAVKLFSVFLGSVVYYIVYQVVVCFGFDTDLLKLLSAIVVIIFLAIPYWKGKYFKGLLKKKKGDEKQ